LIESAQLEISLRNDAPVAVSCTIRDFKSIVSGLFASNTLEYPRKGIILQPAQTSTFSGAPVALNGVECKRVTGEMHLDVQYGKPNVEEFTLKEDMRFTINFDPTNCELKDEGWNRIIAQIEPCPFNGMRLVLPFETNWDNKGTLFRRSWSPFPSGHPMVRRISLHKMYLAVENAPTNKTLRNVRVVMESLLSFPGGLFNLPCVNDRTSADTVDIAPGATEYFLVGEGADSADAGMFRPRVMPMQEYDRLLASLEARKDIGFVLHSTNGRTVSLLKNDGNLLAISVYADDIPPVNGVIAINTRQRIEMFLQNATNV
jgi:hypothetical protein